MVTLGLYNMIVSRNTSFILEKSKKYVTNQSTYQSATKTYHFLMLSSWNTSVRWWAITNGTTISSLLNATGCFIGSSLVFKVFNICVQHLKISSLICWYLLLAFSICSIQKKKKSKTMVNLTATAKFWMIKTVYTTFPKKSIPNNPNTPNRSVSGIIGTILQKTNAYTVTLSMFSSAAASYIWRD